MKGIGFLFLLFLGLAVLSGGTLFWTSQEVQHAEVAHRALEHAVDKEQRELRVLNAEWNYLNRPDRIEVLAQKHLGMVPATSEDLLASLRQDIVPTPARKPPVPARVVKKPASVKTVSAPKIVRTTSKAKAAEEKKPSASVAQILANTSDRKSFQDLLTELGGNTR